jgi:eukaryotic-like serine/threonine-protein kinase
MELLGYAYYYAGLDELAEKMYRHAIEIDPTPQEPHWMHARMLLYIGKARDAEEEMRQVLVTNPDQFKALAHLGSFLYYQGKLDGAEKNLDRAVELARGSGDYAEPQLAAIVYAARNEREKIDPRLFQYRPEEVIDGDVAYYLGGINALLGHRQAALKWLRRTVELGDVNYPWFQRDKTYDKLRADPEYRSIMAGVRQQWEANKQEFDLAP